MALSQTVRSLSRSPALSLAAVFCLAVGLGATTAIFSAVDTALLRPLPFPAPDRLVSVFRTTPHFSSGPFSPPNYLDLWRETSTLESLAAATPDGGLIQVGDRSIQASVVRASDDYFAMLGAQPLLGRLFRPGEEEQAESPSLVLSEALWQEQFGGDRSVIGRTVRLDGVMHHVAGVLPRTFAVPHGGSRLAGDAWVPLRISPQQASARRNNYLMLQGRLAPGVSVEQAHAELRRLMDGIVELNPELRGEQLRVAALHRESKQAIQQPLTLLLGAVALVLLIAAANVASLLLARGAARRGEWAVRMAIGGSRGRLLSSAMAESAVLAAAGIVLGFALAWAATHVIGAMVPAGLPQLQDITLDLRVFGFGLALAVLVAIGCGLAPAWQAQRTDPHDALRAEGRAGTGARHHRLLRGLIVVEVALSLVLLLSGTLVLRGFRQLVERDPGFDPTALLTLDVDIPAGRYEDRSPTTAFLEPALEAIRALPGVRNAAAITLIPYTNWGWNFNIRYEGVPGDDPTRLPLTETRVVSPAFFETMSMTLLRGRLLSSSDDDTAPAVAVVNRALVERDFPDGDPIGKRFHRGDGLVTIVGVVSDIKNVGPDRPPQPEIYRAYAQVGGGTSFPLVVNTQRDPVLLARPVTRAILDIDPQAAVGNVQPMEDVIAASMGRPRFYLVLIAAFAAVAAMLAMAGLYGVMSYAVEQRRREIGIRSALGSTPLDNLALVVRNGGSLIAVGAVFGLGGGLLATRLLEGMLFGLSRLDPAAWAAAPVLLALAGIAAVAAAGRRAASVDPMVAIRE